MCLITAVVKDGGIDRVVCSGGSHLLNVGSGLLASPAVAGPTSLGVVPSSLQWFHQCLAMLEFKTLFFQRWHFLYSAFTSVVQMVFLKKWGGVESVVDYLQDSLNF